MFLNCVMASVKIGKGGAAGGYLMQPQDGEDPRGQTLRRHAATRIIKSECRHVRGHLGKAPTNSSAAAAAKSVDIFSMAVPGRTSTWGI